MIHHRLTTELPEFHWTVIPAQTASKDFQRMNLFLIYLGPPTIISSSHRVTLIVYGVYPIYFGQVAIQPILDLNKDLLPNLLLHQQSVRKHFVKVS